MKVLCPIFQILDTVLRNTQEKKYLLYPYLISRARVRVTLRRRLSPRLMATTNTLKDALVMFWPFFCFFSKLSKSYNKIKIDFSKCLMQVIVNVLLGKSCCNFILSIRIIHLNSRYCFYDSSCMYYENSTMIIR